MGSPADLLTYFTLDYRIQSTLLCRVLMTDFIYWMQLFTSKGYLLIPTTICSTHVQP
jgi:hypothetical protein